MAYFSVAPTLCEITYDSNRDEKVTPYRYQCRSANSRATNGVTSPTFTEIVNVSLPIGYNVSYYEYLRTLYDSRISSPTKNSGHYASGTSPVPGHYSARSFYPHNGNNFPVNSPIMENRPKTAGPFIHEDQLHPSLPSIHHGLYHSTWGDDEDIGSGEGSRHSEERLKWIDALNKWIPEQNQSKAGYVSFVGNAPMVEKLIREHVAAQKHRDFLSQDQHQNCERFEQHMLSLKLQNQSKHQSQEHAFARRLMTLKKREAMRRRNAEMLELRKQRKNSSSPHSPMSERRLKVRFRTPSLSPKKTMTVPNNRDLISIPKESWGEEKPESDQDSSRIDGSSEGGSQIKQTEEDPERKESESDHGKKGNSLDNDGEQASSHHSSTNSLPPISMETTEKDGEDEESKKVKKASSNKVTVSKVKSVMQNDKKGSKSKTKATSKTIIRKLKNGKGDSDDGEDLEDTEKEKTEPPAPIPMIGDTKTGPLSLIAGQDSRKEPVKKTRVNATDAQSRRRQSLANRTLNFEKKRAPKAPSPPRKPPTPPTPEFLSDKYSVPDLPKDFSSSLPQVTIEEPPLPDASAISKTPSPTKNHRTSISMPIKLQQKINRRKSFKRDTSYEDELRRQELLEKRRQKQMALLEKMKSRQGQVGTEVEYIDGAPSFDDYGFLAKYCIFNRGSLEMYKRTFDVVDDECRGWLNGIDAMIALRGVNNRLTLQEEEYLYRILEIAGYNISKGADFKLFSVLAALSHRISAVDDWMKILIDSMDFKILEMKTFMCKTLWECNVDKETNRISLDQLCIELRAGGVSEKHEKEVREKLSHLKSLDLLDFLTYVPLFIMIHQSVVNNPLNDVRDK
ncbi:uncharacterized protein LOC125675583 isoform X13 [Ostrea edulis]|uniref:uncharacterized protein LOC125675583 isoform X13 n=1 Tax=Ostrea edulis TaxID=37623 RepID=UPI0024AF7F41|nr:uncharacterized protein LOC125675583 isoform X13 [Ostrea edulis]